MPVSAPTPCDDCAAWSLRYLVAVRASYYLALHITSVQLRERVLDHVTTAYTLHFTRNNGDPGGFQQFFDAYIEDVERDIDATRLNTAGHPDEYRRVWTNHAAVLSGRLDLVRRRLQAAA